MIRISDEEFDQLISQALDSLPGEHVRQIRNIAIVMADDPTPEQREMLKLRGDQTLLGLYEGVPLPQRQGRETMLPDKITLFKNPLCASAEYSSDLLEEIRHTIWHEIGHYYGLGHKRIHELES
jgi:predicted Zn-dependent protease with MMP-like domain